MTPRQLRILRGSTASTAATLIAALSHTLGGGAPPHPLLMLAVAVLLAPVAAILAGRRPRLAGTAAAVGVTQIIFHLIFEMTGSTLATAPAPMVHQHGQLSLTSLGSAPLAHTTHSDGWMFLAHVIAAITTALLLWRGELMVTLVARWIHAVLRRPVPSPRIFPRPRPSFRAPVAPDLQNRALGGILRRGPPLFS